MCVCVCARAWICVYVGVRVRFFLVNAFSDHFQSRSSYMHYSTLIEPTTRPLPAGSPSNFNSICMREMMAC